MKRAVLTTSLAVGLAAAQTPTGSVDTWAPGGPNDLRGPCPMMNTLANHGFLPHDGRNLTQDVVVNALFNGIGFDQALGTIMFTQALVANPTPNATFFDLGMLNVHNVLEHDASISRTDAFFGNNHVFNQTVFDTSRQFFTADTLTAQMFANAKLFRQIVSRSTNPEYSFTTTNEAFSLGEMAAPIIVFGDLASGTVDKKQVEFFFHEFAFPFFLSFFFHPHHDFKEQKKQQTRDLKANQEAWTENEQLPSQLGWTKKTTPVTLEQITRVSDLVHNATNLFTPDKKAAGAARRDVEFEMRNLHLGTGVVKRSKCPYGYQ